MIQKVETPSTPQHDWFKWSVVFLLLIAGIVANFHYNSQPWPLRLLGWMFLLAIAAGIALLTTQGKQALDFARESRMELRKVFWPTRQEVVQTTLVVAAMVILLSLVLWVIDSGLMWLIGWLTGQRG
jgi:preprotein translocase subunit SecE